MKFEVIIKLLPSLIYMVYAVGKYLTAEKFIKVKWYVTKTKIIVNAIQIVSPKKRVIQLLNILSINVVMYSKIFHFELSN